MSWIIKQQKCHRRKREGIKMSETVGEILMDWKSEQVKEKIGGKEKDNNCESGNRASGGSASKQNVTYGSIYIETESVASSRCSATRNTSQCA